MGRLALKFLSGKYQGGELPLPARGSLLIGRAPELDIVLVEDMVSRKHARLEIADGVVTLVDLGSTNGSFVNGLKVDRARVNIDDKILVGTSILRLTALHDEDGAEGDQDPGDSTQARAVLAAAGARAAGHAMAGELREVALPDLLQLFALNRKSGALTLERGRRGHIYLKDGAIYAADLDNAFGMPPLKVVCRLLEWTDGRFSFDPGAELPASPAQFGSSSEAVVLEAMRQNDEARALRVKMPSDDSSLQLVVPIAGRLSELAPEELDTLQLAINQVRLGGILDRSETSDQRLLLSLQKLIQGGFLSLS